MAPQVIPKSDLLHNPLEISGLSIQGQVDIYSQETLSSLMNERFNSGLDFYVVVCENEGRPFFFEGGRFVEHFVKESELEKPLFHPITREKIVSFQVYKATPTSPHFVKVLDESDAKLHVNCLPILLSDHERSEKEKGIYYFMLGECYLEGKDCERDHNLGVKYLKQGAELGNDDARYNLALELSGQGKTKEALYWTAKPWEGKAITKVPVRGINEIANCFERLGDSRQAFLFFNEAACRGNPYAIAKVIRYYDKGFGVSKDATKVQAWKRFIPPGLRGKTSYEYLACVVKKPRLISLTCNLPIPGSLKKSRPDALPNLEDDSKGLGATAFKLLSSLFLKA
ncbi:MAG: sel1 repeat family protein [Simkaniaceae bacterium]|nr:sel1 repeat family protein [Simkaniaceae bacterium]